MSAEDIRLQPKMTTALDIAVLVKQSNDFMACAELIETYARAAAAQARIDAQIEADRRFDEQMRKIQRIMSHA